MLGLHVWHHVGRRPTTLVRLLVIWTGPWAKSSACCCQARDLACDIGSYKYSIQGLG